jgi:hypothetical protein
MRRTLTALALSTLFVAAPAFAKTHIAKHTTPVAGDSKAADSKPAEAKPAEGADAKPADAKPAKKVKKSKKSVEKTETPAPEAAPAK